NHCIDDQVEPTQAISEVTPVEGATAKREVRFLPEGLRWIKFTKADYWVLRIDTAYRVSLVETPDRRNLWLLAREPAIDPAVEAEYLAAARAQGFDLTDWIRTPQSGRPVTDDMLDD